MQSMYFCNYSIGADAYRKIPEVCAPFGKRVFIVGGQKALGVALDKIKAALGGSALEIVGVEFYGKDCTYAEMDRLCALATDACADMIFGVGGGRAMDTAKGCAAKAHLPIFTFPTIASTCSATTAVSVTYNDDGTFKNFYRYPRPSIHAFIDTSIIGASPWKFTQAGIGDTMGKFFESRFSARGEMLEHKNALGVTIAEMCYEPMKHHAVKALNDCKEKRDSEDVREICLANIVSTGLVSLCVDEPYNGALAHSVYYGLTALPHFEERFLHGNVVAYGILIQLLVDKKPELARELKALLTDLGIDTTLSQMGVATDKGTLGPICESIVHQPDMTHIPYAITPDMVYRAMLEAEAL